MKKLVNHMGRYNAPIKTVEFCKLKVMNTIQSKTFPNKDISLLLKEQERTKY